MGSSKFVAMFLMCMIVANAVKLGVAAGEGTSEVYKKCYDKCTKDCSGGETHCEVKCDETCDAEELKALICYNKLVLWNPLTSKYLDTLVCDVNTDYNGFSSRVLFGLCYDSSKDEYKVVVGSDYQSPPVSPLSFDWMVDYETISVSLYNFKDSECRWLRNSALGKRLLDRELLSGEEGKVISGVPHWVVQFFDFEEYRVQQEILYFDLKEEMFKVMERPNEGAEKAMLGLATMDGEKQLGCLLNDVTSSRLELWVMKEYGVIESWSNMITFPYLNVIDRISYMDVMGFMPNGELLLLLNHVELWVYDVVNANSRRIKLKDKKIWQIMTTYEPRLISPPEPAKEKHVEAHKD